MVGGEVCRLLAEQGHPVRALARQTSDAAKIERLRGLGAEIVEGDLRDAASIGRAVQGADAVIVTASSIPFAYAPDANSPAITDRSGVINLIDAAREAGVGHFVYTSFPPYAAEFPLQDAKRAVEAHLRASGLTHTILQPTYFMEVWLSPAVGFDYANRKATIYGEGENPASWISFRDVASFAVAALDNPAARNATLELGGPEGVSPLEVIRTFERVGGKPWEYVKVPLEALRTQMDAAVDPLQRSFAALMYCYGLTKPIDMTATLRAFPMTLTRVEDYARQVTAAAPAEAVA
jgi:NADH dehydrogenase